MASDDTSLPPTVQEDKIYGQYRKSGSSSNSPVPFPLGNLKKLTIFPAIGGMMASDDTSLHPTVQEDKSCGQCRKSESSNYSTGTLSTSINISQDSSCSKSSRQSGSAQFNYSSRFQDNTSRTAVKGSKNSIGSEENNCGTSQKYYHKDFHSDSSATSSSEECGSFTIPLLKPLETKEWNFPAEKKENDLHTKGGKKLPKKKPPQKTSAEDHTINAQEKNNMAYHLLSARDHKIKELKNKVAVLQNKLETSTLENKMLKGLQWQHLKAIKKYENAEINLPELLATHSNEVQTLRALLKKSQEEERRASKKLRDVEVQLLKTTDSLRALQKLCGDKKLEEREQFQRKLTSLTQKLEASDKRTQDLEKQLSLNTASFRHQLAVEKKKIIEAQSITENLQVEVKSLKLKTSGGKKLPKKKPPQKTSAEDHTINAQEKNNMAYHLLSARDHKIKELKNKVAVLQNKLETSTLENKMLKGLQWQHLKAIKKYENAEINLPDLLATRSNEVQTLRALLKKSQEEERRASKKLRDVEVQLLKTTDFLRALQKLCGDKKLEEREQLQRKLTSLTQKLEASDKRTQDLEKQLSLNTASFRHQLAVEKKKIIEAQSITENLQVEVAVVQNKLETSTMENKMLKGLQCQHLKTIKKYENAEINLPELLATRSNEVQTLRALLKKSQEEERRASKKLRDVEVQLLKTTDSLRALQKLCEDKKLEEREQLQHKLTSLTQKLEASDKRTQDLEKQLSLNTASFRHQLAVEKKKIIEAQSITENLQVEVKSLKLKLQERERELSITNIYAHRIRKGQPEKSDSCSSPKGPLVNPKIPCSRRPRNRQRGEIAGFVGDSVTNYEPSFARFRKERQKDSSSIPSEENSAKIPPGKKRLLLEKLFGPNSILNTK